MQVSPYLYLVLHRISFPIRADLNTLLIKVRVLRVILV